MKNNEASETGLSTKTLSSNYKLNQAGVPILTKILNKDPIIEREDDLNNLTNSDTVSETIRRGKNITKYICRRTTF